MSVRRVGIGVNFVQQGAQFPPSGGVGFFNERFKDGVLPVVNGLGRTGRNRIPTVPTPVMVGRKRLPAVPTRLSNLVGGVVALDDARLSKDILSVLCRRDVFVGFPHVGVERPMHAMFDLRPAVALADHSRDGGVAEGVGLDVSFQVGPVSDSIELLADRVRINTTVVTPSTVTVACSRLNLVEQRHVRVVRSRVRRSQVRANRSLGVNQRVLGNRRSLQPGRVAVRRVRRRVRQVDILDTEREGQREACASVGKELDERHVPLVARRRRQRLNVGRRENVVGADSLPVATCSVNVVGPLDAGHVLEINDNGRFEGFDGAISQFVLVAQVEDQVVEIVFVKFDDGRLRTFACKARATDVDFQTRDFDRAALLPEPVVDRTTVGFVDIRTVFEAAAFVLETLRKVLRVVRRHTPTTSSPYYKLPTRESTSSISCEIAKQRPDEEGNATLRERFLDQFEDGDRRRVEAARTDPLQTHLTARDARTWGGEPA